MTLLALKSELNRLHIRLSYTENCKLRIDAKTGILTPELYLAVKRYKSALHDVLLQQGTSRSCCRDLLSSLPINGGK